MKPCKKCGCYMDPRMLDKAGLCIRCRPKPSEVDDEKR